MQNKWNVILCHRIMHCMHCTMQRIGFLKSQDMQCKNALEANFIITKINTQVCPVTAKTGLRTVMLRILKSCPDAVGKCWGYCLSMNCYLKISGKLIFYSMSDSCSVYICTWTYRPLINSNQHLKLWDSFFRLECSVIYSKPFESKCNKCIQQQSERIEKGKFKSYWTLPVHFDSLS